MHLRICCAAALLAGPAQAEDGVNERLSVDGLAQQATGSSHRPAVSFSGRHVAFFSDAPDLVLGDTNDTWDCFVRDRLRGTTTRVSVSSAGVEGDDACFLPTSAGRGVSLSGSGRYVAYHSKAGNLVQVDTNYSWDCFVHDRDPDGNGVFDEGNGTTEMVSVDSNGYQYASYGSSDPWISKSGRYVAFGSRAKLAPNDTNAEYDVYVRDRKLGKTILISVGTTGVAGNGESLYPVISGSGAYVAYESLASDLVPGDTNGARDVFLTEVQTLFTRRVSVASGGVQADGPSWGAHVGDSGFLVTFSSEAANLYALDDNGWRDVFLHDITLDQTFPISVAAGGVIGDHVSENAWISPNGRFVAFESLASNLTDEFAWYPRDVYVLDRKLDEMRMVSRTPPDMPGHPHTDWENRYPAVNCDGQVTAYESLATNLIANDTNGTSDVYARRRFPRWWNTTK